MLDSLKDMFNFNKRQERGIFVLSFILFIVIILNYLSPTFTPDPPEHISENIKYLKQVKLQAFEESKKYQSFSNNKIKVNSAPIIISANSKFDPNSISVSNLVLMGLPEKIAHNIYKYRTRGGCFYKKGDLKKIYGMTDEIFVALEPYISIEKKKTSNIKTKERASASIANEEKNIHYKKKKAITKSLIKLGINNSDSLQLLEVSGIGPYYAGAIVKFGNRLGGYHDIRQLNGLYKMDSAKYNRMINQLFLDSVPLRKIKLNTAEFKAILRHPYIDYETTKYIVNKRKSLGKYAAIYQLKDSVNMPDELYNKLRPYLSLD